MRRVRHKTLLIDKWIKSKQEATGSRQSIPMNNSKLAFKTMHCIIKFAPIENRDSGGYASLRRGSVVHSSLRFISSSERII